MSRAVTKRENGCAAESKAAISKEARDWTPDEKKRNQLDVISPKDGDNARAYSETAMEPAVKAATIADKIMGPLFGTNELMGHVRALRGLVSEVKSGDMRQADAMLVAQAYTLDSVFAECLHMWTLNKFTNHGPGQEYLKMALKAQSQARTTWESLSNIKNPHQPTFVRQANIANGPQQVNNNGAESATAVGVEGGQTER